MLLNVNDHSTNSFIQQIRRYISSLERPLTTARGDKKSYIYANFNPKYAQFAITILRTYYNFCRPFKSADKKVLTPAQRLGITDKQFDWKDIIYFKNGRVGGPLTSPSHSTVRTVRYTALSIVYKHIFVLRYCFMSDI